MARLPSFRPRQTIGHVGRNGEVVPDIQFIRFLEQYQNRTNELVDPIWGNISGTLADQNDLKNALDGKADTSHTHTESDITDLGNYIEDAPSDGTTYGRNNGAWSAVGGNVYSFAKRSSTDTSNANPTLIIPWQTAVDSHGSDVTWDSGNNTRFTVQENGVYEIGCSVTFESPGQRAQASVEILINGTGNGIFRGQSYIRNSGFSWDFWAIEVASTPYSLSANDYVEFRLSQNSGAGATYGTSTGVTVTHSGTRSLAWVSRVA